MSSPMMKRIFGFASPGAGAVIFSCATAGLAPKAVRPTAKAAPRSDVVPRRDIAILLMPFLRERKRPTSLPTSYDNPVTRRLGHSSRGL
jgi:hypothetical protein